MHVGDQLTIGGRTAEVIKVRKTAPVAVVEYGDGSRELRWYGDESPAPAEAGPVRGPRVKTGGFADTWIDTHILGPINSGPSSDELAEAWGLPNGSESTQSRASAWPAAPPVQSPSLASQPPETPSQAQEWQRAYGWYDRAGLCPRCSAQGAWGVQLGYSNVKPPCNPCAVIVDEFPAERSNGWRRLHRETAAQYALTATA